MPNSLEVSLTPAAEPACSAGAAVMMSVWSTVTEPVRPAGPTSRPLPVPHEVIHPGGKTAVIVPGTEFLRLRALESTASAQALEDAEDAEDAEDWPAREANDQTTYVPLPEVRRLGLADSPKD